MLPRPAPRQTLKIDQLPVEIYADQPDMGLAAAHRFHQIVTEVVNTGRDVNIIFATGNSQLPFFDALRALPEGVIPWDRIVAFHMDEYIGIDPAHPASFPRFLRENLFDHVTPALKAFHAISGQGDPVTTCRNYAVLLRAYPADMVIMGLGENGHIAFNDPPYARFDDPELVKVIELAEASRRQQVGEGHFPTLIDVPTHAITLTIPALLSARQVLCLVPETRKADAVYACLRQPISEDHPGSILRTVPHALLLLDPLSSARLVD